MEEAQCATVGLCPLTYIQRWRLNNPDYFKLYVSINREKINQYQKEYKEKNAESIKKYHKKYNKKYFQNIKENNLKKKIEKFKIDLSENNIQIM